MKNNNTLTIGGYTVQVQRKKIKNMYLRLGEEGTLRVSAPLFVSYQEIATFVLGQEAWVQTAMAKKAQAVAQLSKRESLPLWGFSYPLTVTRGVGSLCFDGASFHATLSDIELQQYLETGTLDKYIQLFYRQALEQAVPSLWAKALARAGEENVILRFKWMKTRWGTCNPTARRVWLNPRLAQYPPNCLYYVMLHELCHLREPRHDRSFYTLLEHYLPNWREAHNLLKERLGDAVP